MLVHELAVRLAETSRAAESEASRSRKPQSLSPDGKHERNAQAYEDGEAKNIDEPLRHKCVPKVNICAFLALHRVKKL